MKKVINGKMYNTETAELLHEWDNGLNYNDFSHCSESLYKTKKGNFFLHGEGGPASTYAKYSGNSASGNSDIITMTENEAIIWLEKHDGTEAIEKHFADHIEEA